MGTFILGLIIGVVTGITLMAMLAVSKDDSKENEHNDK